MATIEAAEIILEESGNGKDKSVITPKVPDLLECLLNDDVLRDKIAYKIMAALVVVIKDGTILTGPHAEILFEAIEEMLEMSDGLDDGDESKRPAEEIATALFSNACACIQAQSLAVQFLPRLLKAMKRDGNMKWSSYPCVSPLLMSDLKSFQPHLSLLLSVMRYFPGEVLSVIGDLYKLGPHVFEENIALLIELYDLSPAAQLSILHILQEISLINALLVEPYLQALKERVSKPEQTVVVKDIEENVVRALPSRPTKSYGNIHDADKPRGGRINSKAIFDLGGNRNNNSNNSSGSNSNGNNNNREITSSPSQSRSITFANAEVQHSPLQQGVLKKKGRILGRTITRWFSLDENTFNFYRTIDTPNDDHQPKRKIPYKEISEVQIVSQRGGRNASDYFPFSVHTRARTYQLAATTENDRSQWIAAFKRYMNSS